MRHPLMMLVMVLLVSSAMKANPLLLSSTDVKFSSAEQTSLKDSCRQRRFGPPISGKGEGSLEEQKRSTPSRSNPLHNR
ncbi:hypothetical protein QJS10_CPA01g01267 [Acorus calamus]|uniref:Uncharacterized protein n=1 Tax=Acorus calamus TaxID=4465 RepID=A0AAV9FKH7_ACOCL|nr:hypothetical protein QJS10_CPA01g01267 [Acorus calamus]